MKGVLGYTEDKVVATDFRGESCTSTFDADADAFVPGAGRYNGARLGAFHQLDLRVDRHWIFDDWRLTTYLEARNAYNRANPEGVEYAYDYRHQQTVSGLPILPSFGLRGTF